MTEEEIDKMPITDFAKNLKKIILIIHRRMFDVRVEEQMKMPHMKLWIKNYGYAEMKIKKF
jgi:hypothetical protein